MSKGTFANEEVMEEYLDALLFESEPVEKKAASKTELKEDNLKTESDKPLYPAILNPVEHLLEKVSEQADELEQPSADTLNPVLPDEIVSPAADKLNLPESKLAEPPSIEPPASTEKQYVEGDFQALFFEVAGLALAVPLTELGGIHNLTETSPLFGKPAWFKGIMINRDVKINVVDTALWVMPEKCDQDLVNALSYKYIIMLGESHWGLACETLVNTVTLKQEDIKWRAAAGKRPWLAGLVKQKMCALLNVEQLILLLNKGLDSQDG